MLSATLRYGYQAVWKIDGAAKGTTGEREIIPEQAEIARRIFRHYAEGNFKANSRVTGTYLRFLWKRSRED